MPRAIGPIVIGLCCLLVLGAAAGSMDGAVETDPAEVINSETISLALDQDSQSAGAEVRSSVEDGIQSMSEEERGKPEQSQDTSESGGGEVEEAGSSDEAESGGFDDSEEDDRDFLTWLLAWLRGLLPPALGVLLAVLGVGAIIVHRDRIRDILGRSSTPSDDNTDAETNPIQPISPDNEVERAWISMLEACGFDLTERPYYSSRQWADAVIDAGADPEPVGQLTRLYEDVRYRDQHPTEEQVRLATRSAKRIRGTG